MIRRVSTLSTNDRLCPKLDTTGSRYSPHCIVSRETFVFFVQVDILFKFRISPFIGPANHSDQCFWHQRKFFNIMPSEPVNW